jgi:hypothetical protein
MLRAVTALKYVRIPRKILSRSVDKMEDIFNIQEGGK